MFRWHNWLSATYGDGQVVAASELSDLARVAEGGAHDDGLVAVLLVVVKDVLHRLDTRVLLGSVVALVGGLVPVQNTADEGRDEESTGLGGSNSLDGREHERQVAVDAVLRLQDLSSLDTLVGRGNLDQNAVLRNTNGLVELCALLRNRVLISSIREHYLDEVQGLVNGGLGVKGEASIDLGGDLAGNDLKNLLAKLNQKTVEGGVNLLINGAALWQNQYLWIIIPSKREQSRTVFLPYSTATSMSLAYSGFLEAARIRDGLVVASCGLYLPIAIIEYQYQRGRSLFFPSRCCINVLAKSPIAQSC